MCKFHEDVAIDIATDPVTGEFRPGVFGIARTVLARYHVEQYMPDMFGLDGRSAYAMACSRGVDAFRRTTLAEKPEVIRDYRNNHIGLLHQAVNDVATRHDLSVQALGLPKNPMKDSRVLNEAAVDLIEGYTADNYFGDKMLYLKKVAHKPSFEPLRSAAEDFLNQPGVEPVLKKMVEHSFSRNFLEAREKVNPILMKLYEKIPPQVLNFFNTCVSCGGSVVAPHLPCIGLMTAAGSSTWAAAIISNPVAVPVMSVIAAFSGHLSWKKMRGSVASPLERMAMKPIFALAAAGMIGMHLPMFGGHDHSGHEVPKSTPSQPTHDHSHHSSINLSDSWQKGLSVDNIGNIERAAQAAGLSAEEYMNPICRPAATVSGLPLN